MLVLSRVLFVSLALVSSTLLASDPAVPPKSPLSPEESLKHLVLGDPNLVIEIVAAEPEVIDPVAMQFDEHGRLWVVEMRDYPTGPKNAPPPLGGPDAKPLSRIKLLEDKDGDGRFETAHVFAENLLFATGVQPWDGGVIVTHSGEIVYLKDTDGDKKADVREVWFTGFSETNTQLRANHPTIGPDGWIYVANGLRGGNVIAVKKEWPSRLGLRPDPSEKKQVGTESQPTGVSHDPANPVPVSLTGRDFKFDPLTGRYEAISGNGQYGMTFDAWGNRFVCDNRHPCRHVIFEEDFIRRCPHIAFPTVVNDVIPPDDKNKVFPLTSAWTTSNLHAGTFTASCGVTVYTGDWLPEEFRGNVFVCEPTGNLVQRAVLEPDGVTFKSRNPYERPVAERSPVAPRQGLPNAPTTSSDESTSNSQSTSNVESRSRSDRATETQEFLVSRDDWFRPVDLQNGPDGALYVVDMYRAVIEHPEWVPDELKNRPDTWLGNDKGRIYRIRPKQKQPIANKTPLDILHSEDIANGLDHQNGWHRMGLSRLWCEGRLKRKPFEPSAMKTPEGKCLAIQLMPKAFADENADELDALLESPKINSWVKARAAALTRFSDWSDDRKRAFLSSLIGVEATDASVLKHALIEITIAQTEDTPFWSGTSAGQSAVTNVACFQCDDLWTRLAFLGSTIPSDAGFVLSATLDTEEELPPNWNRDGLLDLVQSLAEIVGKTTAPDVIESELEELAEAGHPRFVRNVIHASPKVLLGIASGLSRKGIRLEKFVSTLSEKAQAGLRSELQRASRTVESADLSVSTLTRELQDALLLLRHATVDVASPKLRYVMERSSQAPIRLAALESFSSFHNSEITMWLIDRYPTETPAIRRAILSALLASKERQLALLGAIAEGKIAATEIDPVRAKQLTEAKDEAVREKARQVLAAAAPASRKEVLEAYQPALTLKGDAARGREVFQKNCVTCHKIGDLGVNVAPDISDTRTKKPEQLLLDILDPNRAIDANYFAYAVVTKDGKAESGVIASESSNSITLKQPEGKTLTLLRSDIEELRNTGLSLMPVGVEKNINQQQMADLIFWLKNWRYLDGKVPATSLPAK
jgi:putative membrane-bound dehydrogenase-like protein